MRKPDAIQRPITEAMIAEAKTAGDRYGKTGLASTRLATEDNDLIGDLAHMAVENIFDEVGIDYNSTRFEVYENGGDKLDIAIAERNLDVKGQTFSDTEFYVFDKELRALKIRAKKGQLQISHFLFVHIDRDYTLSRIFGFISVEKFIEKALFRSDLQYPAWGVQLYQLQGFKSWLLKQLATNKRRAWQDTEEFVKQLDIERAEELRRKLRLDTITNRCNNTSMLNKHNPSLVGGEQPRKGVQQV